jgi:hypothetical protein
MISYPPRGRGLKAVIAAIKAKRLLVLLYGLRAIEHGRMLEHVCSCQLLGLQVSRREIHSLFT